MSDYLSKPFEENELLQVISRWLGEVIFVPEKTAGRQTLVPLYDLSKLEAIAKGNQAFIVKMVNMFIEQGPASVKEITDGFANNDLVTVSKVAHRLKTSINNMGIASLSKEISEIEQLAEMNTYHPQLKPLIANLEKVVCEVVADLKEKQPIDSI